MKLSIALQDVSCTEVWLNIHLDSDVQPRLLLIKRDTAALASFQLMSTDTTVMEAGLLPGKGYVYQAYRAIGPTQTGKSAALRVATMDTTSHDWNFSLEFLGGAQSSRLYDVAIVNDTLAYAVGEIYLNDSSGNVDPHAYNMAKWNGKMWSLNRIQFYTIPGQPSRTPYPASSLLGFSASDVWIAMDGDQVARWDGTSQTETMVLPVPFFVRKLWGWDNNSIYAVGSGGKIVHFSNGTWKGLESGTDIDLKDIWGSTNQRTGELQIACVASFGPQVPQGRMILGLDADGSHTLADAGLPLNLNSIWFVTGKDYLLSGSGIFTKHSLEGTQPWNGLLSSATSYYTESVRGNGVNDVIIVGDFGETLHFNGISWESYRQTTGFASGAYVAVSVKGNLLVAVGHSGNRAVIAIARRH